MKVDFKDKTMQIFNISFGSSRTSTPFILKDLIKSGRVSLSKDFYGNSLANIAEDGTKTFVPYDVDHLKPVAQGGTDELDNLVISTQVANRVRDRKPLKDVINIRAAIEYLKEVAGIKEPEFDGKQYATGINKTLLDMDIYLGAPGVKKRRIDRPMKTPKNGTRKFKDMRFRKF